MVSRAWRFPTVSKTHGWEVSDNGENVVAFGPAPGKDQFEFEWGTTREDVAALIGALGHEEFTRQARTLDAQAREGDDFKWSFAISEFTVPAGDNEASPV